VNLFDREMIFGLAVLLTDIFVWRLLTLNVARSRPFFRTLFFVALTYVLWDGRMIPLHPAPWSGNPTKHYLAQALELFCWLQAAQVLTALLAMVLIPQRLQNIQIFRDAFRALIFIGALFAGVAHVLDMPVSSLLATSGALVIVLGLAVQRTLSDVFSGVVLSATQPFLTNDFVCIGGVEGEVVESNWRTITLLSAQGNLVIIPNSAAARSNIVNKSRPPHMHGVSVSIRLTPLARPATVISALEDAIVSVSCVLSSPTATVSSNAIHRKYVEYEIFFYIASAAEKANIQNEIIDQAYRHLRAHGIALGPTDSGRIPPNLREDFLRDIEIFQALNGEQIAHLASQLTKKHFCSGQISYQARRECGSQHDELCIVAAGVAVLETYHEGDYVEIRRLSPGDAIGRAGILTGVCSPIKLRAIGAVLVFTLCKDALTPILQTTPALAKDMLDSLVAFQAREAGLHSELPAHAMEKGDTFHWLLAGARRLHSLVH